MKRILSALLIAICLFGLLACSRVTQENFDKVKPQMTMEEVIAILGEPTSSESLDIAGLSGTSAVWKSKTAEIDIQFLNNKMTVKTFSKLDDDGQLKTPKPGNESE